MAADVVVESKAFAKRLRTALDGDVHTACARSIQHAQTVELLAQEIEECEEVGVRDAMSKMLDNLTKLMKIATMYGTDGDRLMTSCENCMAGVSGSSSNRVRTFNVNGREIRIQESGGDSLGSRVWSAAIRLAIRLEGEGLFKNMPILELGAGCGFAGIAMALSGASVYLTDRESTLLSAMEESVKLNLLNIERNGGEVSIRYLDWEAEKQAGGGHEKCGKFDYIGSSRFPLIVGSDIIYSESHADDLVATTIAARLDKEGIALLLCPIREHHLHDLFVKSCKRLNLRVDFETDEGRLDFEKLGINWIQACGKEKGEGALQHSGVYEGGFKYYRITFAL